MSDAASSDRPSERATATALGFYEEQKAGGVIMNIVEREFTAEAER